MAGMFNGLKVQLSEFITTEKEIRRHKRKRINKKWNKRYGVLKKTINGGTMLQIGDTLFIHPDDWEKIKRRKGLVRK